ncbi:MAG: indole-3-glycerol phosphate synthase TrpC, partial [Acidobacteriota bacterium]|nr:indole-3-glycerol phosphate synthase TrpC [Acidobacteriota bacterium]
PDILAQIIERKKAELKQPTASLQRKAEDSVATRRLFAPALVANTPAIIAEIKKASPSKGVLAASFDPGSIAQDYQQGGAAALSVLTDTGHFQGSLAHLQQARAAVQIPVLRKDFTIAPVHIIEAAAHGADAILLIAAILSTSQLREYRELAAQFGMAALVEVHDADELRSAMDSGAQIIGVNNRNLHTFEVNLDTSLLLAPNIPAGTIRVAESGIHSAADVHRLAAAGYQAFLVGEHLMRSTDPARALQELRAGGI